MLFKGDVDGESLMTTSGVGDLTKVIEVFVICGGVIRLSYCAYTVFLKDCILLFKEKSRY